MKSIQALTIFCTSLLLSNPVLAESPDQISAYLNPEKGQEIGLVFEAFMSPMQEPHEEDNAIEGTDFSSTEPSFSREERVANKHSAHGVLRFTKDLSKAYIDIKLEAINLSKSDEITMFHLHCGKPGILGPIVIDFALITNIYENIGDDGIFSIEINNADIVENTNLATDIAGVLSRGCFIPSPTLESLTPVKVTTIAGIATIAKEGDLYFNLHTKGQNFYGDMRGQLHKAKK